MPSMQILFMISALVFLIATRSSAYRLKQKPELDPHLMVAGPVAQQTHMALNRPVSPQMTLTAGRRFPPSPPWTSDISTTQISEQKFPPTEIFGVDTERILNTWEEIVDISEAIGPVRRPTPKASHLNNKATVLFNMRNVVAKARETFTVLDEDSIDSVEWNELEMVGLISKDSDIKFLESGSSEVDESVRALGLFSRGQLEDDGRGSLCKYMMSRWKDSWTKKLAACAKKRFDVFVVEGLADVSAIHDDSARELLSKIERYARKEQSIVVVSPRALFCGTDLSEYYVHLGFKPVVMADMSYLLVYTGSSSSAADMLADKQHIMVGMNLWSGV